jgi:hypothetical protein
LLATERVIPVAHGTTALRELSPLLAAVPAERRGVVGGQRRRQIADTVRVKDHV